MNIMYIVSFRHPGTPDAYSNFTNVYEAFVEIIKDLCLESQATQSGSEDPEVSSILQNMFIGGCGY